LQTFISEIRKRLDPDPSESGTPSLARRDLGTPMLGRRPSEAAVASTPLAPEKKMNKCVLRIFLRGIERRTLSNLVLGVSKDELGFRFARQRLSHSELALRRVFPQVRGQVQAEKVLQGES
jgi:hypothetical protein